MADEATQPATQKVLDPRRLGKNSSDLSDEDLSDIFCILHPVSLPAIRAAALVHDLTPQHTITSEGGVNIREKEGNPQEIGTFVLATQGLVSCDIALRISANLKSPAGGFLFGRNQQRCDFILGRDDQVKRVSNIHFRIYINEYGIIMLEDQSTNGTAVDGNLLRAKEKENGMEYRHTLELGSRIILTMTPPEEDFKFIVRIPRRDEATEATYQQNLTNYFIRIQNTKHEKQARIGGRDPPNIFAAADAGTPNFSTSSLGRHVKEWKGGAKYNKIGTIGKGAFAVVYKITDKYDGIPYAAKELEKRRFMKHGILDQKVDMEMRIMQKIQHKNIVQYVEHVDWEEYLYIIMEFVPGGDLGSVINKYGRLQEVEVKSISAQLLSALKYLHGMGITHRDVKPDNILIHSNHPFHVKLTDFGLSKMVDSEETFLRTFCGTLLYCAPEVYSEYREYDHVGARTLRGVDKKQLPPQRYDHAVDIWSLAGVLFFALCACPPYPVKNGISYQELLNIIMTQPLDIRPLQKVETSDRGIRFIRQMLHVRPEYRATIEELESSPWLTGASKSTEEMSIDDDDEVDMIQSGCTDPELEEGASQLSLHPRTEAQNGDDTPFVSDLTEMQHLEIPNSFSTSMADSNGNKSYEFTQNPSNGRLFGEVDAATLQSSGAIHLDQLPVPNHRGMRSELSRNSPAPYFESEIINDSVKILPLHRPDSDIITLTSIHPLQNSAIKTATEGDRGNRSSSLMGAESMVGHLNMHSPSAVSPPHPSPSQGVSLRRPHEEITEDDRSWQPADLPAKRLRKSIREIDMLAPQQLFWDPKDKATHHNKYPQMTISEFNTYQELAQSKGELFEHGHRIFDTTIHSFFNSRSPSVEPGTTRAQSEPTTKDDQGRRNMMKRDERKLSDGATEAVEAVEPRRLMSKDRSLPATAHGSNQPSPRETEASGSVISNEVVSNDFQPPKRILGKVIATHDSCLPTINLNITETITSWGRKKDNTIWYPNGEEIHVPKYAFKIFGFKLADEWASAPTSPSFDTNDLAFYISSKATFGVIVNGVKVPSYDRQTSMSPSKYWGELRHGDIITVWQHDRDIKQFTKFRFECYHGMSREPRQDHEPFALLPPGEFLDTLETYCQNHEREVLRRILSVEVRDNKSAAT